MRGQELRSVVQLLAAAAIIHPHEGSGEAIVVLEKVPQASFIPMRGQEPRDQPPHDPIDTIIHPHEGSGVSRKDFIPPLLANHSSP